MKKEKREGREVGRRKRDQMAVEEWFVKDWRVGAMNEEKREEKILRDDNLTGRKEDIIIIIVGWR